MGVQRLNYGASQRTMRVALEQPFADHHQKVVEFSGPVISSSTSASWRSDVDEHIASTTHVSELFRKLEEIAADADPNAHDADPVSALSVAVAGDVLNRISNASTCRTLSRNAAVNAELYPSRDGGILLIVPLNSKDFEFMIAPDGEIDLGISAPVGPAGTRSMIDRGVITAEQVVRELKTNS